jgi:hypothetical protein
VFTEVDVLSFRLLSRAEQRTHKDILKFNPHLPQCTVGTAVKAVVFDCYSNPQPSIFSFNHISELGFLKFSVISV